ncbi:UNVERIFIED_CONTAM: hypothetical protein NY603_38105, partial [Bacteroidetes bacterium 56_B9]
LNCFPGCPVQAAHGVSRWGGRMLGNLNSVNTPESRRAPRDRKAARRAVSLGRAWQEVSL